MLIIIAYILLSSPAFLNNPKRQQPFFYHQYSPHTLYQHTAAQNRMPGQTMPSSLACLAAKTCKLPRTEQSQSWRERSRRHCTRCGGWLVPVAGDCFQTGTARYQCERWTRNCWQPLHLGCGTHCKNIRSIMVIMGLMFTDIIVNTS